MLDSIKNVSFNKFRLSSIIFFFCWGRWSANRIKCKKKEHEKQHFRHKSWIGIKEVFTTKYFFFLHAHEPFLYGPKQFKKKRRKMKKKKLDLYVAKLNPLLVHRDIVAEWIIKMKEKKDFFTVHFFLQIYEWLSKWSIFLLKTVKIGVEMTLENNQKL